MSIVSLQQEKKKPFIKIEWNERAVQSTYLKFNFPARRRHNLFLRWGLRRLLWNDTHVDYILIKSSRF